LGGGFPGPFVWETAAIGSRQVSWFEPETIVLLKTALDDAWNSVSEDRRARASRTDMAVLIFKLAKKGVRDPVRLRTCALTGIARPTKAVH
jgi:hypothetical protein